LKRLDGDPVRPGRRRLELPEVAHVQSRTQGRPAGRELPERLGGDVEPPKIQPGVDERKVVAPFAAADVEAEAVASAGVAPDNVDDRDDERQRWLVGGPAATVLVGPARP